MKNRNAFLVVLFLCLASLVGYSLFAKYNKKPPIQLVQEIKQKNDYIEKSLGSPFSQSTTNNKENDKRFACEIINSFSVNEKIGPDNDDITVRFVHNCLVLGDSSKQNNLIQVIAIVEPTIDSTLLIGSTSMGRTDLSNSFLHSSLNRIGWNGPKQIIIVSYGYYDESNSELYSFSLLENKMKSLYPNNELLLFQSSGSIEDLKNEFNPKGYLLPTTIVYNNTANEELNK